jgi:hypothetical protein
MTRGELILATVEDAATSLMFYDRKEDEDLPVGAIEEAVAAGEITVAEMVDCFRSCLEQEGGLA